VSIDTDTNLKETIELMKQEIQVLKNERMMYNERLGELETEIRKGRTNFEML
jgi:chaperonin cofactor prefoldin